MEIVVRTRKKEFSALLSVVPKQKISKKKSIADLSKQISNATQTPNEDFIHQLERFLKCQTRLKL